MKKLITLIILISLSLNSNGQNSFEGLIKFSTKITTTHIAPKGFQKKLSDKYGDSLIMYYSKTGDFRRVHLNSSKFGVDSQLFISKKAKIYLTKKNSSQIDSVDVKENSLKSTSTRKINNQKIIGLDCECYKIKAVSVYGQNVTLNYCFSSKTPSIDPKLYSDHKDFYLNEYYKFAKRPYLKFSIETPDFKIIYLATELIEKEIEKEIFKLK
ncbi:MAG: hypothetical protein JXR05_10035 [Flavobacteriaceae bacterium]